MKTRTMSNRLAMASLALAVAGMGCGEVKTIDRTQPNAIKKDGFQGLWYHKATITEADPGAASAVDGYSSGLEKLRWEITEDLLIGYRSYEFVPYAEGLTDEGRDFFGAPVVAYSILRHFDIQRQYSTVSGVENNVIVENDFDRPWYEREYMRVDWSRNMVGGVTQFRTGWASYPDAFFSGTSLVAYFKQGHESTNPNRPIFTKDYFDVTNAFHVTPSGMYCSYMLLYNGVSRCGAQNVRVRLSFMHVDQTDDFQSLYYPDRRELKDDSGNAIYMNFSGRRCDGLDGAGTRDPASCEVKTFPYFAAFGNFRTQRVAFNKERYLTRTGRIYLAGRFDLWQDSYDDVTGSLIPYAERTPKPVVYYGNVDFPAEIIPAANKMADAWNEPFMDTVALLQGHRNDQGRADHTALANKYGADFRMYEFRVNDCNVDNVRKYARDNGLSDVVSRVAGSIEKIDIGNVEETCAAIQYHQLNEMDGYTLDPAEVANDSKKMAFTWQREGDLRYNFQNYVTQDQAGPWGVAQFGTDPETGEYVSNAANYFGDAGDYISQREVDRLQWLNGDITADQVLRGDTARNTVVSRRGAKNTSIRAAAKRALMQHDANLVTDAGDSLFAETAPGADERRFKAMFEGTNIERELLVTDEILRGFAGPTLYQPADITGSGNIASAGVIANSGAPSPGVITEEAMAAASPVNWGVDIENNPWDKAVRDLGESAVEMADFFEPTTSGLADFFRGKDRDEIYQWLRVEMYAAVQGHEVGHTLGLRHNFGASMDPMNYRPEYWETFWNNPPTKDNPNRGDEYKYASIMDYGFGVSLEGIHGIGPYDQAAIRFMYGELIDVWDTSKVSIPEPRKYSSFARRCGHDSSWPGLGFLTAYLEYRDIPRVFGTAPSADGTPDEIDRIYRELIVRMEANAAQRGDDSRCTLFIADYNWLMRQVRNIEPRPELIFGARRQIDAQTLINQERAALLNPPEYDDPSTSLNEAEDGLDTDNDGVADDIGYDWNNYIQRVQYDYCPDRYAGFSPGCQRWDAGADFLESVENHINAYDRDYIFNNFRRDAYRGYSWYQPWSYMYRLEARRLFHMTNVFRFYLYTRRTVFEAPLFQKWAEAAYKGINFLDRMIQTPEPGSYCLDRAQNMYVPKTSDSQACEEQFDVGLGYGAGKYMDTSWTDEYYYKANRLGVFYDKLAAIRQLTSSSGRFIRDLSDLFDRRAFSLGYMRAYEDPMIRRFSGLVRGDHDGYMSAVITDPDATDGSKLVRYTPFFDEELDDGSSVRQLVSQAPKIAPSWSPTLQFYSMALAIARWSSINDSAPEFYRFTKIAIKGTPEDVDYPSNVNIIEYVDPETRITYRAPEIDARVRQVLGDDALPPYNQTSNSWGIGADILRKAQEIKTTKWEPAKVDCENLTGEAKTLACQRFERARNELNEHMGFVDIVRRFNRGAEIP